MTEQPSGDERIADVMATIARIRATIADLQGRPDDAARERRKQFRVIDGGQT